MKKRQDEPTKPQLRRIKNFGQMKSDQKRDHCQKVYNVLVLHNDELTTAQIEQTLKGWKQPLSRRTIQRCIEGDPRIIKNKKHYSIDQDTRLETRYLDPKDFGNLIHKEVVLSRHFRNDDTSIKNMVELFGVIMIYLFIEASRPFQDKLKGKNKSMSNRDREDLVQYWANNAIPIGQMFYAFTMVFNWKAPDRRILGDKLVPRKSYDDPPGEMEQSQIDKCLRMLEHSYPDVYKDLVNAKDKFYEKLAKS